MTAWLPIVATLASVAAQTPDSPTSAPAVLGQAKVVANRSSVPQTSPQSPVAVGDGESEDRPIERRGARASRQSAGQDGVLARGTGRDSGSGWLARVRSLWPLAVVLGLIGASAVLIRRLMPRQWRGALGGRGMVEVLGRHPLSARQSVALLKVGRRVVLVGVTSDRLTHLDTITDPDEVTELVGRSAVTKSGSLTSTFEREVLREAAAYDPSRESGDKVDFDGTGRDRAAAYVAARQQLRGLLSRVRSMTGSA